MYVSFDLKDFGFYIYVAGLWLPAQWLMQRMSAGYQTELHVCMIWLMVEWKPDANDWHGNQGSRVSSGVE